MIDQANYSDQTCYNQYVMAFRRKMTEAGLHPSTIRSFENYYRHVCSGHSGMIAESDLEPLKSLTRYEDLHGYLKDGIRELPRTAVIKLNGGLGTSMGMDRAKSLLEVKKGLTFLDIIARQVLRIRSDFNAPVPLILMNSEGTQEDTRSFLRRYSDLPVGRIPMDFIQNRVPKIRQSDLSPVDYPDDRDLEWNPPGHGDIYSALHVSGCLDALLRQGYLYAFISNSDNLGAELDPAILGYFISGGFSFLMEVAERTDADRKGGHLARHRDGFFVLREIAQCAPEDREFFADITKHRFFNTNTIWIDLVKLRDTLSETGGCLDLPLIRNRKTVNPRDPDSEPVFQLETAMGAAISSFRNATAISVPRTRFFPVKTTDDLIGLWSDAYEITDNFRLRLAPGRSRGVITRLDEKHYRMIDQLQKRFPAGAPSLVNCEEWQIEGDVYFEEGVVVSGTVKIINRAGSPGTIRAGTLIQGLYNLD
ncbi:UTP--glucose-1-phosphate uridylyltransferase [bacterium]|nr:UTP--glucose-1-phosphate uridylyltransferase [candidate division CSSED10-310 bacterium]